MDLELAKFVYDTNEGISTFYMPWKSHNDGHHIRIRGGCGVEKTFLD